ncbi:MAG TPA: BMP family ABC transporter substrate-binding protein [Candidatus Dormibacteraeota bacterium]|nr:BMP family ABC transporter substrate-binding protein [Candidatus Dormibacteraeota bacterium]
MKIAVRSLLAAGMLFALPACTSTNLARPGQLALGMVTDVGGLGDKSFNDSAYRGMLQAQRVLGAHISVLQSRSAADYQPNLEALANEHVAMIYAVGFLMSKDLDQIAVDHPHQHFAIIDAVVNEPNVVSVTFREQDGSFLAGALAALMSRSKKIAFLGGEDIPLLHKFEAGYIAGAREIDPRISVQVKYIGSFDDVAAGKELANIVLDSGADVIYAAAGKAGLGAIEAVQARPGAYAIGVDSNQDALAPGKILTSMVKRVNVAVFKVARAIAHGRPMSGHVVFGLKENGVGLTNFRFTKAQIGRANLARLAQLRQAIIAGRIVPPATRRALAGFRPVAL